MNYEDVMTLRRELNRKTRDRNKQRLIGVVIWMAALFVCAYVVLLKLTD